MIKKLIAPLQRVLLQKKLCPACTRSLKKAKVINVSGRLDVVACECGRIFVHEKSVGQYRRAISEDLRGIRL
jgi:hypothetical protein